MEIEAHVIKKGLISLDQYLVIRKEHFIALPQLDKYFSRMLAYSQDFFPIDSVRIEE
jgi:hypothetical protein